MPEHDLSSGPVFTDDHLINLYHLNELYGNLALRVSDRLKEVYQFEIPITSGIWGGTYLIANKYGKSRRRIWRLYCLINLPQHSPLDKHENLERLISCYSDGFINAFKPYHLDLKLKMWGGKLPYSNSQKPSITMHMEDSRQQVRWLRTFFVWNHVPWEESVIHDVARILKEYKEFFDLDRGPVVKEPQELKYLLQDIIIIYRTLEGACSEDFLEHAEPIIQELMGHFMKGLNDPALIQELYLKVFHNALIYGYEEALQTPYKKAGLDIRDMKNWPVEKINWVPEELKEKLIPPIQKIFADFKANLENDHPSSS
ncbi:MAG: hypothetical protein NPINA01_01080 [Nitrospinaceae bacterium]|nr:MAG: hypothetical protein NPINA01_01080 [Nitrospinaceae bacterium]